jgi:hypothetical protein
LADPCTASRRARRSSFGTRAADYGNPDIITGMAEGLDKDKYGGSVVYGKDASGNLVAYQPGLGRAGGRNVLPAGVTPIDPVKFVNTGGEQVGVGTRSGETKTILPNSEAPGKAADRAQRGQIAADRNRTATNIAAGNNRTTITVAGMPARAKPGATGATSAAAGGAREALIGLDISSAVSTSCTA